MSSLFAQILALHKKGVEARIDLTCRYYTEGLHALVTLRRHMAEKEHRSALRCVRPLIESSLRSLYAAYVSTHKDITRNSFPSRLTTLAKGIDEKQPQYASMFTDQ